MGLLDKLWDETVAGPQPDCGLSKLRKCPTFSPSAPSTDKPGDIPITRSITIVRTSNFRNIWSDTGSLPSSPLGSSAPGSHFSPMMPREDVNGMRRKSEAYERAVYDWVVISALDR